MKQNGYVIREDGIMLTIQVIRTTACGDKCGNCSGGCDKRVIDIEVENTLCATCGDVVEIEPDASTIISAAFIIYIIPLGMLILSMGLLIYLFDYLGIILNELISLTVGLSFMALGYYVIHVVDKKSSEGRKSIFKMSKIIKKER